MATDKLRRKLRDVEQSDVTGLQQDFCGIGTPLPALDARKKDANELKPIWQQEARDEQGRRRFHGAFTGGFSAGYFNTVGSKEGWNPSSFRSSRTDKANGVAAQTAKVRPEDFMDEEDLQDRKQTQQIQTSTAFAGPSSETHDPFLGRLGASRENDVAMLASALYQQMNPAQKETLGYQLLKRMGWKEGQGLGARLDAAKRRRLLRHLQGEIPGSLDDEGIIEAERKHLFAPPKTDVPRLEERQDRHGLGWIPGTNLRQSAPQQHNAPREGFSSQNDVLLPSIRSAAQPDSDEEDPFGDDGVAPVMESARLPMRQLRDPVPARTAPTSGEKETWRDGGEMLSGFRLSSTNAPATATYTPETLPEGWTPDPARVAELLQAATLNSAENATLSPTARGQLLGEAKLPGPPPSMPAFLVQKAQKATVRKDEWVDVPRTDAATATLALQGFMPYSNEPDKQKQYRSYLESQLEPAEEQASRQLVPADSSAEQFSVLLKEFANKAAISRLMSSTMANRFTSASAVPSAQDRAFLEPGLRQPGSMPQVQAEEPVVDASPAIKVSESPMVDDKADASTKSNKNAKGRQPKLSVDQHWLQNKEQLKAMVASAPLTKASSGRGTERASPNELSGEPIDQLGLGDDQRQGQDTLSYTKPTMDVFKAIFESDDEDSEGEEAHQPQSEARKSKIRDPTLAASVTFQARSKRKDGSEPIKVQSTDKKRKKDKAAKKGGMLSFDLEEGADIQPAKPNKTTQQPQPQGAKNRVKASDLF